MGSSGVAMDGAGVRLPPYQGQAAGVTGVGPQMFAALEAHLSLKGAGWPKTFETGTGQKSKELVFPKCQTI